MPELKQAYPSVQNDNMCSYGGSQMFSDNEMIRRCGCGPVAAYDLLRYLSDEDALQIMPLAQYREALRTVCRRYLPLIPYRGINGLELALGVNRMLQKKRLPYRAVWVFSGAKLWDRIREMLAHDLPVILSIGPNFPKVWEKEKLRFYTRSTDGRYLPSAATKSHYVTVTGMDDAWLQISSWGRRYYISRSEYKQFVGGHSSYLFSNILYVKGM